MVGFLFLFVEWSAYLFGYSGVFNSKKDERYYIEVISRVGSVRCEIIIWFKDLFNRVVNAKRYSFQPSHSQPFYKLYGDSPEMIDITSQLWLI